MQRVLASTAVVAAGVVFWRPSLDHFGTPRTTLVFLAVLAMTVTAVVGAARRGRLVVPRSWAMAAACGFVIALALAWAFSDHRTIAAIGPYTRYSGAVMYAAYAGLFCGIIRYFDAASLRVLGRVLVAVLGVVTAYGLLQLAGIDPWDWQESADLLFEREGIETFVDFSTLGNIDFAGAFVGITFPFVLWWGLTATTTAPRVTAALLAIGSIAYAVGIEAFQGPVTVAVSGLTVMAVWAFDRRGRVASWPTSARRWAGLAVGASVLVVVAGLVAMAPTIERELETGLEDRTRYWQAGLDMFTDAPVFGQGPGGYSVEYLRYRPVGLAAEDGYQSTDTAHNVYVNFLAEGGLIVMLLFLAVILLTARALVRGLRRVQDEHRLLLAAFAGAWLAYLVQATVSIDVASIAVLHWVVAAGIVVLGERPATRVVGRGTVTWTAPGIAVAATAVLVGLAIAWVAIIPLRADLAAGRARELRRTGDNAGALEEANLATDLAPWEGVYWAAHASIVTTLGNPTAALKSGERAAEESPGSSRFAVGAAQVAELAGEMNRADHWFDVALQRDPHNPDLLVDAARFQLGHGTPDRAIELLERAVDLRPSFVAAWELLVEAYDAAGDERAAADAQRRVDDLS